MTNARTAVTGSYQEGTEAEPLHTISQAADGHGQGHHDLGGG